MVDVPDPARHVDEFSSKLNAWEKWHHDWISYSEKAAGLPEGPVLAELDPGAMNPLEKKRFRDFAELFRVQEQVNVMLLAAIDELKRKLEEK